jgi:Zn-dependent alcohol dehydrogenase
MMSRAAVALAAGQPLEIAEIELERPKERESIRSVVIY